MYRGWYPMQIALQGAVDLLCVIPQWPRVMLSPPASQHMVVEHIDDNGGQPAIFCRNDPLAAMHRGMAIREGVDRSMHLNAGAQPIGGARVLEPFDAPLDVLAEQVPQTQLVIVTSQQEVNYDIDVVEKPSANWALNYNKCINDSLFFKDSSLAFSNKKIQIKII